MGNVNKLLKQLQPHLEENEKVSNAVLGAYETKVMGSDSVRSGILVSTDERLVFYAKKMTGYELEVFPYSTISSIEMGKSITGHYLRFYASGNKVSIKWIRDSELSDFVSYVKARIGSAGHQKGNAASHHHDPAEQIKKLAELRDSGILTEQEFSKKKAKLLDL